MRIVGLRFAVCGLRFAVCGLRFAVCGLRFAVCGLRFAVNCRVMKWSLLSHTASKCAKMVLINHLKKEESPNE